MYGAGGMCGAEPVVLTGDSGFITTGDGSAESIHRMVAQGRWRRPDGGEAMGGWMRVLCACFARANTAYMSACAYVCVSSACACLVSDSATAIVCVCVRACMRALLRVRAYIRVRTHVQVCIEHRLRMARARATAARYHAHVQPIRHRVGVSLRTHPRSGALRPDGSSGRTRCCWTQQPAPAGCQQRAHAGMTMCACTLARPPQRRCSAVFPASRCHHRSPPRAPPLTRSLPHLRRDWVTRQSMAVNLTPRPWHTGRTRALRA
jgi:hypothetical protein